MSTLLNCARFWKKPSPKIGGIGSPEYALSVDKSIRRGPMWTLFTNTSSLLSISYSTFRIIMIKVWNKLYYFCQINLLYAILYDQIKNELNVIKSFVWFNKSLVQTLFAIRSKSDTKIELLVCLGFIMKFFVRKLFKSWELYTQLAFAFVSIILK